MRLVNCTEFSLEAEVSKAAITKAKSRGEILQEDDGKYYNLDHHLNAAYLQKLSDRRAEKKARIEAAKNRKPKAKKKPGIKKNTSKGSGAKPRKEKNTREKPSASSGQTKKKQNTRADIDLKIKEVQLKTNEVKYHQLLGDVVMRDSVRPIFNKIYKAATYFGDFGQRYAGEWAAILGITDPDKILDLEKSIDMATEKFMEAFTETVAGEI